MRIDEAVKIAAASARKMKEFDVRRAKGRVDLDTTIMCYRGGVPVAMLSLPVARDAMLKVAHLAAQGFGPDVMAVSHDTFMAMGEHALADPRTGKHWKRGSNDGPGGMQTYVEEFGFDGTISECLVTQVLNRAVDTRTAMQPYEVDGRSVTWLPYESPEGAEVTGDVPEALKASMEAPTLQQHVPGFAFEWVDNDEEKARYHMDMSTMMAIEEAVEVPVTIGLFALPGSPRAQMLRSRLARSQVIDPRMWN